MDVTPRHHDEIETEVERRDGDPPAPTRRTDGLLVWVALTLGFLAFVTFGSVTIHQWRWNAFLQEVQEDVESVRIVEIWTHQADRLPSVEVEPLVTAVFYAAIFTFIAGSIAGAWLLLDRAGTGSSRQRTTPDRSDTRDD